MSDKAKQILEAAELLRRGDVATGMRQILGATSTGTTGCPGLGKIPAPDTILVSRTLHSLKAAVAAGSMSPPAAFAPIDRGTQSALISSSLGFETTGVATASTAVSASGLVEVLRLQALQEAAQQQYLTAYALHLQEAQELHDKQQEAAQLALIMEAAEAQAEAAKQALENDKEEQHWHRRLGRGKVCGHWQRGDCRRGGLCTFTHPEKERGTMASRGPADIMRHNFKTGLCKFFMAGNCPQSTRCMFAHGPQDLRAPGMALSKDEEDIVQKVAMAKAASMAKGTSPTVSFASTAPSLPPPAIAPAALLPDGSTGFLSESMSSQLLALAGLLASGSSSFPCAGMAAPVSLAVPPPPVRPKSACSVTISPPQLSPAAIALLAASQDALEGAVAKRVRLDGTFGA